jgi:hypothetical protein
MRQQNLAYNPSKLPKSLKYTCDCGEEQRIHFSDPLNKKRWQDELANYKCIKCGKVRFPKSVIIKEPSDLNPENLLKLKKEGKNYTEIAKILGVSDRTIRRRFKLWTNT